MSVFFSADVFVGHSIVLASPKHYNALQLLHWISTNNLSWAVSSGRPQLSPWPFHASKTSTPWVTLLLLRLTASMKYRLSAIQNTFPKISPQCCSSLSTTTNLLVPGDQCQLLCKRRRLTLVVLVFLNYDWFFSTS